MFGRFVGQMMVTTALCGVVVLWPVSAESAAKLGVGSVTPAGPGYTLVFADEFNGHKLDTGLWNYRQDRKLLSVQLPQNVSEDNGVLSIALRKQKNGEYSYAGGGIVSKRAFRYGYFEVRARTTACAGWHSAFWAMAADPSNTYNAARRTEIDEFEIDGSMPDDVSQGVIAWRPVSKIDGKYKEVDIGRKTSVMTFDTSAGWHTYGFSWDERSVRFFVDGRQTDVAFYPASANVHDALNLWLTAIATHNVDDSCLPAVVQFDYLRYYVRDIYVVSSDPKPGSYRETGHWEDASKTGFTREDRTRVSRDKGATAQWKVKLPASGNYAVYTFVPSGADNDPAAHYRVTHVGARTIVVIDTKRQAGWIRLGKWYFRKGESAVVELRRNSGAVRADTVKFVRE